jgi:hypothetical protein
MADNDTDDKTPEQPARPARAAQTFQGLGSLRQAIGAAQRPIAAPAAPIIPVAVTDVQPKIDEQGRAYATGKRKNAVARVWIRPGNGKIEVNGRDSPVYFARPVLRMLINQSSPPLPMMPPAGRNSLSTTSRIIIAALCQPLAASPPNRLALAASASR